MTTDPAPRPRDPWHWLKHRWGPWRIGRQTSTIHTHAGISATAHGLVIGESKPIRTQKIVQYRRCQTCQVVQTQPL